MCRHEPAFVRRAAVPEPVEGQQSRFDKLSEHLVLADDVSHHRVVRADKIVDLDECAVAMTAGAECSTTPTSRWSMITGQLGSLPIGVIVPRS